MHSQGVVVNKNDMKNLSVIIGFIAILTSCTSAKNDSKNEVQTLIFEENKKEIGTITQKCFELGLPAHAAVTKINLAYLDTLNLQISEGDFQAALNIIQSLKPYSRNALTEVIESINKRKDITFVLFEINKTIKKQQNQLLGKYHLIEDLIPIAITDKTEYSKSDSIHISVFAHGTYESLVPIVRLQFDQRQINVNDYNETYAHQISLAASDIKSDTIKGVFLTPNPLGGDIKKNFNIPLLIK